LKNQPYNPDEVWTVEGPTRRKEETVMREQANNNMKKVLDDQTHFYRTMKTTAKQDDLAEGKMLCE